MPSFDETMSKTQNPKRLTRSENGVENPKGLSLRNGQKPVKGLQLDAFSP